jgi:hypothetical protein
LTKPGLKDPAKSLALYVHEMILPLFRPCRAPPLPLTRRAMPAVGSHVQRHVAGRHLECLFPKRPSAVSLPNLSLLPLNSLAALDAGVLNPLAHVLAADDRELCPPLPGKKREPLAPITRTTVRPAPALNGIEIGFFQALRLARTPRVNG